MSLRTSPRTARLHTVLLTLTVIVLVAGCDSFLLGPLLDGADAQPLALTPVSTVVAVGTSVEFTASGGYPPYAFSVVSGEGSIDTATGVYTAPSMDGEARVGVTDLVGTSRTADVTITVPSTTDVNYGIDAVSWTSGDTAGQAVAGTITVSNGGGDDGTHEIGWQIFASLDETLDLASDYLVDFGTMEPLAGGETASAIGFSGFWPETPGVYYLIALLSTAPDDPLVSNNQLASVATTVSAPPAADVDYVVTSLTNAGSPARGGTAVNETFEISNTGPDSGASAVFWTAYLSVDSNAGDPDDDLVDTGTVAPPAAGDSTGPIPVDAGIWPAVAGDTTFYLVVAVSASDEPGANASNNVSSAAFTITRPDVNYTIGTVTNSGTPAATGSAVSESFQFQNIGADAGSNTVFWEARMSTDAAYDPTDTFLDSGTAGPLGAGASSAAVPVVGTWPSIAGDYYIVVQVSAGEDTNPANNSGSSGAFTVNAPGVTDYTVTSITSTFATVTTNSAVAEGFTYKNAGETDGAAAVSYTVYASADATYDGSDVVIGGASLGAGSELPAGASSTETALSATWPSTAGSWYLVVKTTAADDSNSANDYLVVGPFSVNAPPDYSVQVTSFPVKTYGGAPGEAISSASSDHGGSPTHRFTITETALNDGLASITWAVYESADTQLDGADVEVAGGSMPRLLSGGSQDIDVDFTLPAAWGYWYYIVTIFAADDENTSNNSDTVGPVLVWQTAGNAESDTNEDDNTFALGDDFSILLNPGDSVFIDGLIDEGGMTDSFAIHTGPGTTEFQIRATWLSSPAKDNLDLYLYEYPTTSPVDSSTSSGNNVEPASGYWTSSGLTPSGLYYLDAFSIASSGDVGDAYTIEVTAGP